MDAYGNIYGVSATSTSVFMLSPNGAGGWNPAVIHSFAGSGKLSGTPAVDQAGNIYVTITAKGGEGAGSLHKLSLVNGQWTARTLHDWKAGWGPYAGVIVDAAGNIYGTTGGSPDNTVLGTVYELTPKKDGGYKYSVLWTFTGYNGNWPYASLTLDRAGNLYGTTYVGGEGNAGAAFKVTP